MSNTTYSNRKLALIFSSAFMVQSAFDVPIANGNLDKRHPMTTPTFHSIIPFREETRDCTGEFITIERLTGKIARFTFAFDVTAKIAAGWFAYLQGVSVAPTGTAQNEQQTLSLGGATLGDFKLNLDYEGLAGTTAVIAYDSTAAQIKAILEVIRPIKVGNVDVTGSVGGPFTVEFKGALAKANIPLMTVTADTTTGGTGVAVTASQDGGNKVHQITRSTSERPVLFSLIEGFDGESGGTKKYKNLVLNSWTFRANRRGKASLTIEAFGDPTAETLTGFSIPACVTEAPIQTKSCRIKYGSAWISGDTRELTYTESNNIDVSEDALRFDDITPDQLERGDRTATFNVLMLGSPTVAMYQAAENEDTAFEAFQFAIGDPGERLNIYAPNSQYRLDDGLIEFVGTRNKSAFRILGRPSPDNSNVVTRGEYLGAFTGQFLLSS